VFIRVHPWLEHIGCGFAALRWIAALHSAGRWEIPMCGTIRRPAEYNSAIQQIENQLCSAEDLL